MDLNSFISELVLPWSIRLLVAVAILVIGWSVTKLIVRTLRGYLVRYKVDAILINFIASVANYLLLLVVVVAALAQLGINTASLIALIGAAGLAVGLALQDSLANFAAGVMLILFRPFHLGDFVEAAGQSGVVTQINIVSTRLRTGDNREIIVPNGQIYSDSIVNHTANETRRIDLVIGIGYGDDLRLARSTIQQLIADDKRILADPAPTVAVAELAGSSVNLNVRPWVKQADYWDVKADLTERIKLEFDARDISIPYPQIDVHLNGAGSVEKMTS